MSQEMNLFSDCCERVRVVQSTNNNRAYDEQKKIFQSYTKEAKLYNGKVAYKSDDEKYALYFTGLQWRFVNYNAFQVLEGGKR